MRASGRLGVVQVELDAVHVDGVVAARAAGHGRPSPARPLPKSTFWSIVVGVVGVGLLWRQADEVQRERWLTTGRMNPVRLVFGSGGWASYARVGVGVALVVTALFIIGFDGGSLQEARLALLAGGLGVAGLLFVVGPWVFRLSTDLSAERPERIRTQERADVAAHLHDSVLQTLALIQKAPGPGDRRPARPSQERDLRRVAVRRGGADDRSLASALRGAAAEVEDGHGVAVERRRGGRHAHARDAAPDRVRGPRGDDERGQARRRRPGRRLRRGRRAHRVGSSSGTAAWGSTPTPCRRTAWASATPSWAGWSGTAARRGAHRARRGHRGPAPPAPRAPRAKS